MSKSAGIIFKMSDGRFCICYSKQPALEEKGKIILFLVDEKCNPIIKDGKVVSLIRDLEVYKKEVTGWEVIGFVD